MASQPQNDNPPAVKVEGDTPVKKISSEVLQRLGQRYRKQFEQYRADRKLAERKWMRSLRQYLGIYDPDILSQLPANASQAYPRLTRVKCVSLLSRVMNLMFPGNERNWEVKASPSADMDPEEIMKALQELQEERQKQGLDMPAKAEILEAAVQMVANKRAEELTLLIDDQLQELGGDQTLDYILLNRAVLSSGIRYGLGVLRGPFVREVPKTVWRFGSDGQPEPVPVTLYKPQYEVTSVWDFYPDMSGRRLPGDGYYIRMVMGKAEFRALGRRKDFFEDQVKKVIRNNPRGEYTQQEFEAELRSIGTKAHVNDMSRGDQGKYEVIVWHGPVSCQQLKEVGADIPDKYEADDIEAELWMVGDTVIKADINGWRKLGLDIKTVHTFVFDEDDTSPIGNGLPNVMRDSQMAVCAAARMVLDNASVTCGPNLEVNLDLLRMDQDLTSITPRKIWYREGGDIQSAQAPAVRKVEIDGHIAELQALMGTFMQFADMETFIGPATGGDIEKMPSEPFRTAAGASMMKGDAALPFKDIVRNYDSFTQSVILSLVGFNKKYNPGIVPEGDYNVIARGATSLVAKEVRGMQMDMLAQTLTDDEWDHLDRRKFVRARLAVRDMEDMLVPEAQAQINRDMRMQAQQEQMDIARQTARAELRELASEAYKNMTQGNKNQVNADVARTNAALDVLEKGTEDEPDEQGKGSS